MATPVLFLTRRLSPAIGGMETQANEFVKYFAQDQSVPLVAVVTITPAATAYRGIVASAPAQKLPVPLEFLSDSSRTDPQELSTLITKYVPERGVLFVDTLFWIQIFPQLRERFPLLKIILSSGGNDIIQANGVPGSTVSQRQEFVARIINSCVDFLAVNSHYSLNRNLALGVKKEKMHIVSGGVDTGLFAPAAKNSSGIEILNAGRLVPFKGVEYLLKAMVILTNRRSAHLTIVGDGPELPRLKALAQGLGLSETVTFLPAVVPDKMAQFYAASDIYCSTPILYTELKGGPYVHTETMGRTFCEAAAAGLPVVGTRIGGVAEMVEDGKTGMLVEEKNAAQIADALERLCLDPQLREQMGRAGREKAEKEFSWNSVFSRYKELFLL